MPAVQLAKVDAAHPGAPRTKVDKVSMFDLDEKRLAGLDGV